MVSNMIFLGCFLTRLLHKEYFCTWPLARVAWWFLRNLSALEKGGSCTKECQSCEKPGRETTLPLCVLVFKLLKPPSYAGYSAASKTPQLY